MIKPIALFGIQFTLSLAACLLIAFWYVSPRLFSVFNDALGAPWPSERTRGGPRSSPP